MLAPAGTPKDVIGYLYKEVGKSLKLPDVKQRMAADGADPVGNTPEQFAAYIQSEIVKWGKVIRQSGAKAD